MKNYSGPSIHCSTMVSCTVLTLILLLLQFGDSQKLRLVRILRSTVMVRVGGGWMALDEFLVKNDPCRGTTDIYCSALTNSNSYFYCHLEKFTHVSAGRLIYYPRILFSYDL